MPGMDLGVPPLILFTFLHDKSRVARVSELKVFADAANRGGHAQEDRPCDAQEQPLPKREGYVEHRFKTAVRTLAQFGPLEGETADKPWDRYETGFTRTPLLNSCVRRLGAGGGYDSFLLGPASMCSPFG